MVEPPAIAETSAAFVRWRSGDASAVEELVPSIYAELRALARSYLRRERVGHTLEPTELVNEAFLRLIGSAGEAGDRNHFIALAANTMRRVLVDHARRKQAAKRLSNDDRVTLATDVLVPRGPAVDLLVLDDALERLASVEPRAARLVELRYFGGLSCEEAAEVLDVSITSVERDWRAARAWLRGALADS